MRFRGHSQSHQQHAFGSLLPLVPEGLTVSSRRNMLKAGLAGMAGLSVPALMQARDGGDRKRDADEPKERHPAVDDGRPQPY